MEASQRELDRITDFLHDLGDERTVIIGGWAVQAYNPWYGSIDIDLVMRAKERDKLFHNLRKVGYLKADPGLGYGGVYLQTAEGKIILDVFTRDKAQPFESRKERLDFSVLDEPGMIIPARVGETDVRIPSRSLLLLFKLKAAWDRGKRIEEKRSPSPTDERGKVDKDLQDVLALVDPARGGRDLDPMFLSDAFGRFPFLVPIARDAYRNAAGPRGYGIPADEARAWIETLLALAAVE